MKTKLFIAVLLMTVLFGCSKESNSIVGDWYLCSTEYSDSSDPDAYHSNAYTKENTIGLVSYTADGKGVSKSIDGEDRSVFSEMSFQWTLSNGRLTITYESSNLSNSTDIIFEGDNKYYTVVQRGTVTEKMGWQRM